MTQTIDPGHFKLQARRIRSQVSTVLSKWGLQPRFKRWRLTQDPDTKMVVLFGILNDNYIAAHTSTPFSNYFDSRLLHDLANELQVQVVSCHNDGLRYAFILDRGQIEKLPTHIDFPYIDNGKVLVRVVYENPPQPVPLLPAEISLTDDLTFARQVAKAFLKVFEDIKLKDEAILELSAQDVPDIVVIDEDEFHKRVAEHEVNRQKIKRIGKLLDNAAG
jgi:hypothetical protein